MDWVGAWLDKFVRRADQGRRLKVLDCPVGPCAALQAPVGSDPGQRGGGLGEQPCRLRCCRREPDGWDDACFAGQTIRIAAGRLSGWINSMVIVSAPLIAPADRVVDLGHWRLAL